MTKIAMIGAGSVVFSRNLTGDILQMPEFRDCTIAYMDIDRERLDVAVALCRKVADALGAKPTIIGTMDRREALRDADFVINMVQIGGFNSTLVDFEIPRKYGLNFTIADTTGPGGLFRALRTFPMLSAMCRDMEQVCPRAVLLNYSNPMAMNMQTVFRTSSIRAVGLCHSVQGTLDHLMRYIEVDPHQVTFTCAGINHMAFYTLLEKDGQDLYPRLFQAMSDPHIFRQNPVRFELMKRLGYFVTESSEHNAEYNAHFIPHGRDYYDRFNVPLDEYLRRCDGIVDDFERLKEFARTSEPMHAPCKSHEYGATIIHSMVTGTPSVIYGNLVNGGTISSLPRTAIVEAPTLVDRNGLHHVQIGELPPQLVGYMMPHITQHELFIRAALEGRRDHVYQACMADPLTAATVTMDKIVDMCDEMIAAYGDELPTLAHRSLVPGSGKTFGRVDSATLRASWDRAQDSIEQDGIREWQVTQVFPSPTPGKVDLDLATPVEALVGKDGVMAFAAAQAGSGGSSSSVIWKAVTAGKHGFVNLAGACGPHEWCAAYAYTEWHEVHGRETALRCGSDDGIRLWLNGEMVHQNDAGLGRAYDRNSDTVTIRLKPGINRLLVKVANYTGGWGFGVHIPQPTH